MVKAAFEHGGLVSSFRGMKRLRMFLILFLLHTGRDASPSQGYSQH